MLSPIQTNENDNARNNCVLHIPCLTQHSLVDYNYEGAFCKRIYTVHRATTRGVCACISQVTGYFC